jgi:chromosome segregation ATPase
MSFFFSSPKAEPVAEEPVVKDTSTDDAVKSPLKPAEQDENEPRQSPKKTLLCLSMDEDDSKLDSAFERALNNETEGGAIASLASPTSKVGLNYDENPTNLYQSIEAKEWDDVVDICEKKPSEATIWIFRNEKSGHNLRWRLLPIHAAIIFRAPDNVIKALLRAFPEGATSKDDQDMTPLHLAFRHDVSDSVLYELLKADPTVVHFKDRKGRLPLDLHRTIAGQTPRAGTSSKKSGIAKLVSIAVKNEHHKTTQRLRQDFAAKLDECEQGQNSKLRETMEHYEDVISTFRSEMAAKIEVMDQSVGLSKVEAENKIKDLEREMKTARLASESLITRFDLKCKEEEELKAKLTTTECKLKEIEWGKGDTLKEKAQISKQIEDFSLELEQVKESRQNIVQDLYNATTEKEGLELSLRTCQTKVQEMEESVATLAEANVELTLNVQEQETLISETQEKVRLMEESISAKAEQITYLQGQNTTLQTQRDEVTTKLTDAVVDLKAKKDRLQELEGAEAISQDVTGQLLTVQAQLKEKEDRLEELNSAEWTKKLSSLTSQAASLQSENDNLSSEVDETRIALKKYEREVADAKTASNSLIKQFHAKCSSEVALKTRLAHIERDLNTTHPTLQSENISLRQSVELLEGTNEELGEKVEKMEQELHEKSATVQEFESEWRQKARELKEQETIQTTELTRSKEKVAILERIISKLQEKIYDLEASNRELQASGADTDSYSKEKIAVLSEEVSSKNSLNTELSNRLHQLEMKNVEMTKQLEKTQEEKKHFMASLKEKQERTVGSLSVRQRMSEALENQLESSQELNEELQTKIKTLEARNGTLGMKLKTMTQDRQRESDAYEMRDPANYSMSGMDISQRMKSMSMENRDNIDDEASPSFAMRQRMKQNVERQVKQAHDKAFSDRQLLLENAKKQRKDIESSFANATAAINMLRDTGMMSP